MTEVGQPRLFDPGEKAFLTLVDKFLVPPFSLLEARAGYWKKRKAEWLALGIESEVGRAEDAEANAPAERGQGSMGAQLLRSSDGREANLLGMSEQSRDAGYYARKRQWEADEDLRRLTAEAAGQPFVPTPMPEPDPSKAIGGLRSGDGRPGGLALTGGRQAHDVGYYARVKKWEEAEALRERACAAAGIPFEATPRPEPDPAGAVGLDSGAGRGDRLLSGATPREKYGGGNHWLRQTKQTFMDYHLGQGMTEEEAEEAWKAEGIATGAQYNLEAGENAWGGSGTSIFDPVLCELAYRWFCPPGGLVLDPFAGGSVRGIVAAMLGRPYVGVDLRPEQVAANEEQRASILRSEPEAAQPRWVVGDSRDLPTLAPGAYDFVFSCPPYYDLEQYSDDPRDLSNAESYPKFKGALFEIVAHALALLKPDRFACFVVGEVRGKDGGYLGLVPDTINAFRAAGATFHNEAILVTAVGSLPVRVSRGFPVGRKLGKAHQNVLVFAKGDARAAADACGKLGHVAIEYGGATIDPQEG